MRITKMFLITISLAGIANVSPAAEPINQILAKVADAYGGVQTITKTHAIKLSGTTFSQMRGAKGPVTRAYQHPDKLLVEIAYEGQVTERRVMSGANGWRQGQAVSGPFHSSMVLQAARMALPRILFDNKDKLIDRGTTEAGGASALHVLEIPLGEGLKLVVEIDPGSGRILRSRGIMSMGSATMEFGTGYESFRTHEGRLVAFKEIHYAAGQPTGYTEITAIEFFDKLPDELFRP